MCGRPAEKPLPEGIDGLFVKGKSEGFEKVCEECYMRIEGLRSRFRPSLGCIAVTVVYDPGSGSSLSGLITSWGTRHI